MQQYQQIINLSDSSANIKAETPRINSKISALKDKIRKNNFPIISNLNDDSYTKEIHSYAKKLEKFKHIIILGTGGSSLTGRSLVRTGKKSKRDKIIFLDNVDPQTFVDELESVDVNKCHFIVISKSGKTLETISQLLACFEMLENDAKILSENFTIITDPLDSTLIRIAKEKNITCLNHEKDIGGRFSIFTNVGLLPSAITEMDIEAIRKGAKKVAHDFLKSENSEPEKGALLHIGLMKKGIACNALMPYIDRLESFAVWYRQLWAETLGKNGKGTTPIKAMGTIDQHSQLQLYLDGPKDKFFTLITFDSAKRGQNLANTKDKDFSYLNNKTIGDVLDAEFKATKQALINNNCPVREIRLQNLDEEALGALAMHFILETIIVAEILDVNPFDQPAVEEVKIIAKKLLLES